MEHLESRQKLLIMIAVMSAMFFAAVNMTIVGTSLPKIIAQIGGMEYFNWVFMIYMLTATVTAMLVGRLSDIYGRKVFILAGIGIFMTGAFLCGTANSIFELISYRGLQGFGGGMIMSTAFATVGDLFSPRERGRWQGLMGGVFGLSSLFGPTLGGYMVDNFDWHWIFWIFLPIGFVAFALIWKLYPSQAKKEKQPVDFLGSAVLAVMIVSLLLGFSLAGNEYAWLSFEVSGLFAVSIVAFVAFIMIEKRVQSPVIPLHLFKNSIFTLSNIAGMLMGMGMFGVIMYTPFFVQGVLGHSATMSGIVEMIMTLALVGMSTITGYLMTKTGKYKVFAVTGLAVMAVGLFLISLLSADSSLIRLVLQLVVVGIGLGSTMPVFQVTVQNAVQHKYLGVATSTMQVFRQIGGTVGVAVMGSVMGNLMGRSVRQNTEQGLHEPGGLSEHTDVGQLQDPQILMDASQLDNIRSSLPTEIIPQFDHLITMLREALSYALTGAFLFSAFIVSLAVVAAFFIKEIPLRTSNRDETDEAVRSEAENHEEGTENHEDRTEVHEDRTENKEKHGSEAAVTYK